MRKTEADTVVIGSGVAGVLVARELARKGQSCTIVERGEFLPWAKQAERMRWEGDGPTCKHNDENSQKGLDWDWQYVYGVGGSCNEWIGTSPRFLPEDFEMQTRYGVMTDWPLSYDDLAPYYSRAEAAMAMSGAANDLMPGARFPLPPHPLSPTDRAIAPYLKPYIPLVQARPTRPVGSRPACCGSSSCELCPIDSRFSVLNSLGSTLDDRRVNLIDKTIAVRLVRSPGGRIEAVECVTANKERFQIHAKRFVIAANAIESAGLLLRSQIDGGATGRYFSTRQSAYMLVTTKQPIGAGRGTSRSTGASYAFYSGPFRRRRAAMLLSTYNLGYPPVVTEAVVEGVVDGHSGERVRRDAVSQWDHTLVLGGLPDELPDPNNMVRLSTKRDSFGIPFNNVTYNAQGPYQQDAFRHVLEQVPRRLAPLGVRDARWVLEDFGAHLLGTLRMGTGDDSVVDRDLRHHRFENLYVSGGAVFPTYSATHPTLTLSALAIRLGDLLASES